MFICSVNIKASIPKLISIGVMEMVSSNSILELPNM